MLEDNSENDSEMFSEVYALLDQLSSNSKEIVDIEGKDMDNIESILVQRTNELSLAVQIAQALMVKHENDTDNINELKKTNTHLKDQQQEYKSLLNQTMESLERNSSKIDSLNEEKKALTKKITSMQVQCEVYEQKTFDLTEENKNLTHKYSEAESKLNKFEKDNQRLTKELDVAVKQLKETQASESSLTTELSNLKTKYDNLEATYNEYYNSTQEELLEIYEKSDFKKRGEMDTLIIDGKSDISKTRSEGGNSINEGQGQKIDTLMQIIEQVSKENAKLKEDYVEVDGLLSEARNEISSLQEQLLSEQTEPSTVSISQEIDAYNKSNPVTTTTTSVEIQTDSIPVKKVKKVDKGSQCNIINVISKKKKIVTKHYTPPASPTKSVSSNSSIDTGNKRAPKRTVNKNKVTVGKDYYYLSPAESRFNSSYSIEGRPRWNLWKLR